MSREEWNKHVLEKYINERIFYRVCKSKLITEGKPNNFVLCLFDKKVRVLQKETQPIGIWVTDTCKAKYI